jgi:hypothetical protein
MSEFKVYFPPSPTAGVETGAVTVVCLYGAIIDLRTVFPGDSPLLEAVYYQL